MKRKKRILVAPLDWGIGHATRCVPVIKNLLFRNFEVIIAADKNPLDLLRKEFPEIKTIKLKGYEVSYSKYIPMALNILIQIPKICYRIKKENKILKDIIDRYSIDGIISDNRFGLYTAKIPCVFITHQLKINSPYFEQIIQNINYKFINNYSQCWIPDSKEEKLSGELGHPGFLPNNTKYIGSLSRMKKSINKELCYDILVIVSGPEPQKTIFAEKMKKLLKKRKEKSIIVLGSPSKNNTEKIKNLTIKSFADSQELSNLLAQSNIVICRSGYSTIMDLAKIGKKAILIPTPGQTEQEYLASYFLKRKICYSENQNNLNIERMLINSKKFIGFSKREQKIDWDELFSLFKNK